MKTREQISDYIIETSMCEREKFTDQTLIFDQLKEQSKIKEIDGIVNFVYWLGKPAVIRT